MGGKRKSTGSDESNVKKVKLDCMAPPANASTLFEWWNQAMAALDRALEQSGSVNDFLNELYSSEEQRLEFAKALDEAFPPEDVVYAQDLNTMGPTKARLWMMSYHIQAGNKGMVIQATEFDFLLRINFSSFAQTANHI